MANDSISTPITPTPAFTTTAPDVALDALTKSMPEPTCCDPPTPDEYDAEREAAERMFRSRKEVRS
jgi:hypothetical protein